MPRCRHTASAAGLFLKCNGVPSFANILRYGVDSAMAEPKDDGSTNEDRFGRQNHQRYSRWSSLLAVVVVLIVVGLAYYFLLK